ncbi:DNA damage-induced cell division inhibitor SosA [Staphylococcus sp. Marseille-Q1834]|uniref:DNA damage-induced cell division inhibitor SosA n=1 Tax=Staphylococcus sp. Marseille-Q1834 TaxID=2866594 RepID=UPI0012B7EFD3|nr:DNA damage-induced cell division inhibitor SosA [Staphylococcus sp. Marseille-Q1834]
MINKYTSNLISNIAIVVISCVVFLVFFISLYHSSQMEQTYEITDHTISKKAMLNSDDKNIKDTNTEQTDYKVFALVQ